MHSKINAEIFREYDIRGIAERDLTPDVTWRLGQAIGSYLVRQGCHHITLGRDCRLSSDRIRRNLSEGLFETGLSIVDIGVCPTPLLYFSLHHLDPDGGIMITGSHNPGEYNGFKIAVGKSTIYGEQIQEIRQVAEAGDFVCGVGEMEEVRLEEEYRNYVSGLFGKLSNHPRVVVDAGNGMASKLAPQVYKDLGCQVAELYCTMDGTFPNHHPDPTVEENLQDLVLRVGQEEADVGIAFDGDADRISVVDERGHIIWGDQLMILYSREILRENPGSTIIGEVKCSKTLYDDIDANGGRGIMWRTGHSLIKAKMKEENAPLAGEMSGHMFFADRYFGYDDAIYAGARLLEIFSRKGRKVSELLADVPKTYNTPEIRVDCPERYKFEVVKEVTRFFSQQYSTVTVDGVRVLFEDGWGLVRASNTQPVLVLRFEALSQKRLEEIRELIEGKLEQVKSRLTT